MINKKLTLEEMLDVFPAFGDAIMASSPAVVKAAIIIEHPQSWEGVEMVFIQHHQDTLEVTEAFKNKGYKIHETILIVS